VRVRVSVRVRVRVRERAGVSVFSIKSVVDPFQCITKLICFLLEKFTSL